MSEATTPDARTPQGRIPEARAAAPLHRQLREAILRATGSGDWPAHARVPSEHALCEGYRVSRTTARRAVGDLVREGVLYTVPGKGTFVADRPPRQEAPPLRGFEEDLRGQGVEVSARVLQFGRIEADPDLAARLGLRDHSPVLRLTRLRLTRERPLAIQTSYLPEHLCPGLLRHDFAGRSLYATLRAEYGLDLVGGSSVIQVALARGEEARLLGLEPPAAVLRTYRTTLLAGGEVVEFCVSSFHGTHFELTQAAGLVAPGSVSPVYLPGTPGGGAG